jgi:hypothetical protein
MSEYIHQGDGKLREIKAASGRRSGFSWILFRRPFHPDCIYGESLHLGEVGAESGRPFAAAFLLPSHPRWTGSQIQNAYPLIALK